MWLAGSVSDCFRINIHLTPPHTICYEGHFDSRRGNFRSRKSHCSQIGFCTSHCAVYICNLWKGFSTHDHEHDDLSNDAPEPVRCGCLIIPEDLKKLLTLRSRSLQQLTQRIVRPSLDTTTNAVGSQTMPPTLLPCATEPSTPLSPAPLFIDLVTCYANPNQADGNSCHFLRGDS
jgi:hypothetical protein